MKLKAFYYFLLLIVTAHCSSGGGGSTASRSESTQEKALTSSILAMSSLGNTDDLFSTSLKQRDTSSFCNTNGVPSDTTNSVDWAFDKFICAGAHNTNSPDSALGAMTLMRGIICTAALQGVTYTATGATVAIPSGTGFSTTCFPQTMIDQFKSESITSISGSVTGFTQTGGWDFKLEFRNMNPINDFDIYIRSSDKVIASTYVDIDNTNGDGWTVTIDTRATPSKIIYEAANENRHIRMIAEGTISSAGEVTAVTGMAGVLAEGNNNDEYAALTGTETAGVEINFKNGNNPSNMEQMNQCYNFGNGAANCSTVTSPSFDEGDVPTFVATPIDQVDLFETNPIGMSVSTFSVTKDDATLHSSTLR